MGPQPSASKFEGAVFPGTNAGASLKHREARRPPQRRSCLPRQKCRGLIESADKLRASLWRHTFGSPSKYGFRASGLRTRAQTECAESGLQQRFSSSVLNRPSQQVRRELASGERFPAVAAPGPLPPRAGQRVCPESPGNPATQRGGRSGGEHASIDRWRSECIRIRTVAEPGKWLDGPG
jgi:hypothetical protein